MRICYTHLRVKHGAFTFPCTAMVPCKQSVHTTLVGVCAACVMTPSCECSPPAPQCLRRAATLCSSSSHRSVPVRLSVGRRQQQLSTTGAAGRDLVSAASCPPNAAGHGGQDGSAAAPVQVQAGRERTAHAGSSGGCCLQVRGCCHDMSHVSGIAQEPP